MRGGGFLLIAAGGWLLCQTFGGQMLSRLGISGQPTAPTKTGKAGG